MTLTRLRIAAALALTTLSFASAAVFLHAGAQIREARLLSLVKGGGSFDVDGVVAAESIVNTTALFRIGMIYLALFGMAWFTRCATKAAVANSRTVRHPGAWSFWGWVVPIISFVYPQQIINDLWVATGRESKAPDWINYAWGAVLGGALISFPVQAAKTVPFLRYVYALGMLVQAIGLLFLAAYVLLLLRRFGDKPLLEKADAPSYALAGVALAVALIGLSNATAEAAHLPDSVSGTASVTKATGQLEPALAIGGLAIGGNTFRVRWAAPNHPAGAVDFRNGVAQTVNGKPTTAGRWVSDATGSYVVSENDFGGTIPAVADEKAVLAPVLKEVCDVVTSSRSAPFQGRSATKHDAKDCHGATHVYLTIVGTRSILTFRAGTEADLDALTQNVTLL